MFETFLILFGVVSALGVLVVLYPVCLYIKLKKHEKKVKEVYLQIKAQVDIKCELLASSGDSDPRLLNIIDEYKKEDKIVYDLDLKSFNESFNHYISLTKNEELILKCNEAEEKINYVKDYYNEVVCSYNRFKSNKLAAYLSKSFLISDGKLY